MRRRLFAKELLGRPTLGLGHLVRSHREPGREHLRQEDETGPVGRGRGDLRCEALEVRVGRLPIDIPLDRGDLHRSRPRRSTASSSTSRRFENIHRTKCRPASLSS